ncbi:peptidase S8 [Bacillus mycoides]|uniref:S8 family serine peptidase n=1 Tax=Bacillus mycoides TaxID=1405 RepID=UPI001C033BB5|nr:S8 family serine peptidase [Bacillus mycoides]QWH30916.1 peptidase S8 [Bacillus mycoides]
MKRRKKGKLLIGTLAVGMLLSQGIPYNVLAESPVELNPVDNVETVLKSLSADQRKALEQLDANPNFTISPDIDTNSPKLVNVIVEFNQAPAKIEVMKQAAKGKKIAATTAQAKVDEEHKVFKQHVESLKSKKDAGTYDTKKVEITREYKNSINGVAMTLPGVAVQELIQSGVVKRVYKDYEVKVEPPVETKETIDPKMADSIPQIGVDKLHAENIMGKGIKVGVLDTGVDYNHPDLKDAYKGGYDFVDNDANPMETTYEDWIKAGKPTTPGYVYYTNHGTHVAGTIAAQKKNNADYAVKGVAPDVDLYAYRVLGPWGGGNTAGILAGMDKAIADGMDVINMSLGAQTNDPLYATSVAVNNAMLSGVVTVVAAGNAGPNEKTLGSPGAAALGISVGASDAAMSIPTFSGSASNEKFENMQLLGKDFPDKLEDLGGQSLPVVFAGLGKQADFTGKDLNGKIALIQRGEITFDEKIKNAQKAGAKAVIVYNNADEQISAYLGEGVGLIPSFRLSKADGERLKALGEVSFKFETLGNTKTEGDHLADFSSRGPVNGNYDIKPDVVAPGVSVFSTAPEYINDPQEGINYGNAYVRLSGTSMATPHVAGTAALILQQHPNYTPFDVKAALMNTSDDLNGDYSVYEAGAGRIDAYQAVHTDTSIKVLDKTQNVENGNVVEIDEQTGSIMFGRHFKQGDKPIEASKKVNVQNNGKEEKSFKVEVEYHGERTGIQDAVKNGIQVEVPASLTVASGQSQELQPKITIPSSAAKGRYEGYIHVTNTNNPAETYQIPFAVMVTEKGFEYVKTSTPSVTNTTPFWQGLYPFVHGLMKLNSPMKTIDVLVKDSKTGKAVGFVGTADARRLLTDVETFLMGVFSGTVYPFTNDPSKPIGDLPVKLPAGDYILELIAYDEEGKSYVADNPLIVDNTAPEVNMDKKPGVIEVNDAMFTEEDGQKAVWVHGTAKDATVDVLKSKGLNYDQSSNSMGYSANSPFINGYFPIQANGDVKFGIEASDIATKPLKLTLTTSDMATAMGTQNYVFVKEGTEYTTSSYDKKDVKVGDTVTMTLSLNNVKQLVSGEFQVEFMNELFKFENVKLNNAVNQYAEEKGLEVSLQEPVVTEGTHKNTVKVGASMNGNAFSGMDGDMPFLDVKLKLVSDAYFDNATKFDVKQASYMKAGQTAATAIPYVDTESFNIIPTHSKVQGFIGPEAFLRNDGSLPKGDYSKIGAQVYAMSPEGKKYKGTIDSRGEYTIKGIPASTEAHTVVFDVPGHLKAMKKFIPGYSVNGEMRGQYVGARAKNLAGDVNGDRLIDIRDIQSVVDVYGKKDASILPQDINQDGVVNETDVRFIEKNFLQKEVGVPEVVKPKETIGKKGLADFLRQIGLEPKK